MSPTKSNCLIAQSGGPTSVINASLSGVIESALSNEKINNVYGAINGIKGVLQHNTIKLHELFKDEDSLETLKTTPAMFLGSCRYKLPTLEEDSNEYSQIFNVFKELDIKYFFYIGGNDSMDTVLKLSTYAKQHNIDVNIIGIPKTIDNDLYDTDHTPGYGSAAKFVATTMLEISHDTYIYDVPSVTIVEIMGRNAGWLTAAAALARNKYSEAPDFIYLPEVPFSTSQFLEDIKNVQKTKKNVIVAVSEGIKDTDGNYISSSSDYSSDKFGHAQLSGTGKFLENLVKNSIGCKARSIELNVLQRSAVHIASLTDINEAYLVGKQAVISAIKDNETGKMITINRTNNSPYEVHITSTPIENVANKEKIIPREWINEEGNNVTPLLTDYMRPLIIGEPDIKYTNGLPTYLPISHLM